MLVKPPAAQPTRVRSVERVHARLRKLIVSGRLPPGAVLSQVQLARTMGVSRTPLREAIRRLEAEGFMESEQNRRARVKPVDPESIDVLFTDRILLEAMGIKVTVPLFTEIDLNGLLASVAALRIAVEGKNLGAQDRARRAVHKMLVSRAGPRLRQTIADQRERCESYRRLYARHKEIALGAYTSIAGACIGRDADEAARLAGRLCAQLARDVLEQVDVRYKPVATRVALRMLDGLA